VTKLCRERICLFWPEIFTIQETEVRYYKTASPERVSLIDGGVIGDTSILRGYVSDKDCSPVAGAWLDFWQADYGIYDNAGIRLRGHQFTDKQRRYIKNSFVGGIFGTDEAYPCKREQNGRQSCNN
jgi:protocatechuate 3,4-dioxygenase beta subunit